MEGCAWARRAKGVADARRALRHQSTRCAGSLRALRRESTAKVYTDVPALALHDEVAKLPWFSYTQIDTQKSENPGHLPSLADILAKLVEEVKVTSPGGVGHVLTSLVAPAPNPKLGAGAGFEPAIPHSRDYEPRYLSISLIRPTPPFWRFIANSSKRALDNDKELLIQVKFHGPLFFVHRLSPRLCWRSRSPASSLNPI